MSQVISSWIVLTVLLGIAAWIAVWSRRQTRARVLSILAFLSGSPVAAGALAFVLGWPMPLIAGLTGPSGDFTVLGSKLLANQAIYVLVDVGGVPRYFVLPWSQESAKKIQDGMDAGGEMRLSVPPFEFSWDRRKPPAFYEQPQPKVLPDKPQQQAPTQYDNI